MTERKVTIKKQDKITREVDAAKTKKGSQREECYAWADKDSAFVFDLPERVWKHFNINLRPNDMPDDPKLYGSGGEKGKKQPILGVTLDRAGMQIMKYITLPVGETEPITRKVKGKAQAIKTVRVRIPSAMNLNAIALWINKQFKRNVPSYFKTEKGVTCYLQKDFTDKGKLNSLKE